MRSLSSTRCMLKWYQSQRPIACLAGIHYRFVATADSTKPHQPVMVKEVLDNLYLKNGDIVLDMTFGAGGHSEAILEKFKTSKVIALDRDPIAYNLAQKMADKYRGRLLPLLGRFSELDELLAKHGIREINGAIIDAGCSSMQFDSASRGFGLSTDGPLDMRMDSDRLGNAPTAADVVNNLSSEDLKQIFELYGEETNAEKIAKTIVHHRKTSGPILTTKQLAQVVESSFDGDGKRMDACGRRAHAATKCFMALRIFVNDELNELRAGLTAVGKHIIKGGMIVVITFHSLEDKIVKNVLLHREPSHCSLKDHPNSKQWLALKKKVVIPQFNELSINSRARSAKLRSATSFTMQHTDKLSESELDFRQKRSPFTMKAIQQLLGNRGPNSMNETPTVALAISGGGYRAVSTSCGAMEALMENGIFDALMYCVGLSGSVWYLSSTYSKKSFSTLEQLKKDHDWIRDQLGKEIEFSPWMAITFSFQSLFAKRKLSVTDLFGAALREILLDGEHRNIKLSSLKEYIGEGNVPLPIFSAAHVRNHYPVIDFWEEVELTPFEATYAAYRLLVPIEHVNSVWKNGTLSEVRDEPKLHYIMGVCGCAFAILLYHIDDANEMKERSFWNSWKDMLRGMWKAVKNKMFGDLPKDLFADETAGDLPKELFADETPGDLPRGLFGEETAPLAERPAFAPVLTPVSVMSEEEFKTTVWEPFMANGMPEDCEDMNVSEAYNLYFQYLEPEDREWMEELIRQLQKEAEKPSPEEPEPLDRTGITDMREPMFLKENPGRNIGPIRRTGFLRNPLYGMPNDVEKYMMNGQSVRERNPESMKRIGEKASTEQRDILVVDSGLGCNVPAIHVARPQREVDIILVVDCETKTTNEESQNFLSTLESLRRQMNDNNMKFPKIDLEKLKENPEQEYYLFEEADDPEYPIVIWFTLYNKRFKTLLNAPRSDLYPPNSNGDSKFNDFDVTPDSPEYSTTNLRYSSRDVDRLRELMRFNIGTNVEVIKDKLAQKVLHLRTKK